MKTGPIMAALLVAGFVGLFSETALNIALGELSQIFAVEMFMTSLILSLVGTIVAVLAPVFSLLLTARVIQAAGLAIILPLTQNVIFTIFPPMFVLGLVMNVITFLNMLSMLVVLPMYMQTALLVSAFATGLIMLPGSLLNCILAPTIGRMFDKYGPRAVITPGTILVVIGYALYAMFGTEIA